MEPEEFKKVRRYLNKTQTQMARILCVSEKSVQSLEQGWREVPASVERQLMFLLFLKKNYDGGVRQCWEAKNCSAEWKENCFAWELQAGQFCWFINGTFCNGRFEDNWGKKIETCRECEVFRSAVPFLV